MADVVKCAVLLWSAALLTALSGDLPPDENGQHVRGVTADRRNGVVWYRAQVQWQWQIRSRLSLTTKTPKLASNDPLTFGIGHHIGSCFAC